MVLKENSNTKKSERAEDPEYFICWLIFYFSGKITIKTNN